MIKLSYIIGTHNEEANYIRTLFNQILQHKDAEDEIIVVDDFSTSEDTLNILEEYKDRIILIQNALDGDFSQQKNFMNSLATGDWIINIDADENIHEMLIKTVKEIITCNPSVEAYRVPRINLVPGITPEDMQAYGWQFWPGTQYINYPDAQTRIYKNTPDIKWVGKVHEQLTGFKHHTTLPFQDEEGKPISEYSLLHVKNLDRQRKQNEFYATIN